MGGLHTEPHQAKAGAIEMPQTEGSETETLQTDAPDMQAPEIQMLQTQAPMQTLDAQSAEADSSATQAQETPAVQVPAGETDSFTTAAPRTIVHARPKTDYRSGRVGHPRGAVKILPKPARGWRLFRHLRRPRHRHLRHNYPRRNYPKARFKSHKCSRRRHQRCRRWYR
jgi:hypothetical protein